MAWYEAHQTLAKHPKTLKLASLLKSDRRYAVGLLHDLFSWGLDAAKKDGTLPGVAEEEIASALDYSGKKGASVVAALVEAGYLETADGVYRIHDWYDYAGKLVDRREDAKRRKDEWKERQLNEDRTQKERERNYCGTVPECERNAPTVPNLTVPNLSSNNNISISLSKEKEDKKENPKFAETMAFFLDRIEPNPYAGHVDFIKASIETKGPERVLDALKKCVKTGKTSFPWIMKAVNEA